MHGAESQHRDRAFRENFKELHYLQGTVACFSCANSPHLLNGADKYFSVTDFSGFRSIDDGFDDAIQSIVSNCYLDFCFRQKIDDLFGATIKFGVSALPAEALHLADRHSLDADLT